MTLHITEQERSLILAALNFTASTCKDKATALDTLYDKIAEPTTEQPTNQQKEFFSWLARMG